VLNTRTLFPPWRATLFLALTLRIKCDGGRGEGGREGAISM